MPPSDIVLHGTELSGHTHRVELLLRALALPFRFVPAPTEVRRSAAFLALNPLGQVPVLQDGDITLSDSNAILVYLAKRYDPLGQWLPNDAVAAAGVQRWLSIAAGELAHGPNVARLIALGKASGDRQRAVAITERLLRFTDVHLRDRSFLAAGTPTIADVACYSYLAVAPEGGIALTPYPAVRAWLVRMEQLPDFRPMPTSSPGNPRPLPT